MYAGIKEVVVNAGLPYDMQQDKFYVKNWGFKTLPKGVIDDPEWVRFQNVTIEAGLVFIINAPIEAIGMKYEIFYELTDLHWLSPKT